MSSRHRSGFTLSEVLTVLVALVVLAAIAVPMWRTHELRQRRDDGIDALLALQAAQDQYFGKQARYANGAQLAAAPPQGLGIERVSGRRFYEITVSTAEDGLGYWATARARLRDRDNPDSRCVELRIDQNGRRFAVDAEGVDRSADCWNTN